MPSAHHITHHLCVSDSQSGLFSVLSQSSRPIVHLFLDTIFPQHDVFKSFLIFASLINPQPPSSNLSALSAYATSFHFDASLRFPPLHPEFWLFHPLCQAWVTSSFFTLILASLVVGVRFLLVSGAGSWEEEPDTARESKDKLEVTNLSPLLSP